MCQKVYNTRSILDSLKNMTFCNTFFTMSFTFLQRSLSTAQYSVLPFISLMCWYINYYKSEWTIDFCVVKSEGNRQIAFPLLPVPTACQPPEEKFRNLTVSRKMLRNLLEESKIQLVSEPIYKLHLSLQIKTKEFSEYYRLKGKNY